jgi:chemotaxis protein methyltransferase CheR
MNTSDTPALTDAELKLLQTLVYQECGMHFDDRRTSFLQDRLQRRLKECQLDSFYSYYRLLISQQGKQELSRLLENLTVNETSFFRNKAQLDLFQRDVMDDILRRKQARRDYGVRIWSAGCSTGQEPYTIAMLVADALSYYYLRNPLPVESPVPKPMVPAPWWRSWPATSTIRFCARRRRAPTVSTRCWASIMATACATSTKWAPATR